MAALNTSSDVQGVNNISQGQNHQHLNDFDSTALAPLGVCSNKLNLTCDTELRNENGINYQFSDINGDFNKTSPVVGLNDCVPINEVRISENHNSEDISGLLEKLSIDKNTIEECGFAFQDLYKYASKFYKDKSGKAIHISYQDNCFFVALIQQITSGPFNPATAKTLGVLDVVGRDRRIAWHDLGCMSKEEAIKQFVEKLNDLTPTFKPYLEAILADHLEKKRIKKEEEERLREEEETKQQLEEERKKEEEERRKQEETKRQIQEALNRQTFGQFKIYAEQQYPGNPEQQAVLIRQLQDQHYQQYMQQVYQQQLLYNHKVDSPHSSEGKIEDLENMLHEDDAHAKVDCPLLQNEEKSADDDVPLDEEGNEVVIAPASVWTRRDIKDFKSSIRLEGGDSVIKIGHGETVTVRVPTHQDGACLFWEFATDSYDIGFGILFEWRKDASSTGVTVHVTDSDDEDDDDEDEEEEDEDVRVDDVERIAGTKKTKEPPRHPVSVIIPVYRRDSHEEVYAGSHCYPGSGVYLLKFDNSYSLWRNKMLYYRVYYTQR